MGASDDARRRRIHQDDATRQILGLDPRASTSQDALQAQRNQFATVVQQFFDAGYDPYTMIEMMLAGAAFFGDNFGVSRQQLASWLVDVRLKPGRQLILVPR